mmetsp:Transcript_45890/g.99679  ORF Transcript_45890/g.99679 Transcript_45890/m.99679 type:complete len:257 (-) Transcript_45890:2588-3358(-)
MVTLVDLSCELCTSLCEELLHQVGHNGSGRNAASAVAKLQPLSLRALVGIPDSRSFRIPPSLRLLLVKRKSLRMLLPKRLGVLLLLPQSLDLLVLEFRSSGLLGGNAVLVEVLILPFVLARLEEQGRIHKAGGRFGWSGSPRHLERCAFPYVWILLAQRIELEQNFFLGSLKGAIVEAIHLLGHFGVLLCLLGKDLRLHGLQLIRPEGPGGVLGYPHDRDREGLLRCLGDWSQVMELLGEVNLRANLEVLPPRPRE